MPVRHRQDRLPARSGYRSIANLRWYSRTIRKLRGPAKRGMLAPTRDRKPIRGNGDAHTDRREPLQADAQEQRTRAVHGGQPAAHVEYRDDCGFLWLRRGLYRPKLRPVWDL